MSERWLPVVGYEGLYEISDEGNLRRQNGELVRAYLGNHGYRSKKLKNKKGKYTHHLIHRLVLEAFVGPCPIGYEAMHYPDPNKENNSLKNLKWGTRSENHIHRYECEPYQPNSKLTANCIARLRDMEACGVTQQRMAEYFNVSQSGVCRALRGENWANA